MAASISSRARSWASGRVAGLVRVTASPTPARQTVIGVAFVVGAMALKNFLILAVTGDDIAYLSLFGVLPAAVLLGGTPAGVIVSLGGAAIDTVILHEPIRPSRSRIGRRSSASCCSSR